MKSFRPLSVFFCAALACTAAAQSPIYAPPRPAVAPVHLFFAFNSGPASAKPGFIRVAPTAAYSDESGFGYEPGASVTSGDNGNTTTSDKPFLFSVKVPEGNYTVIVSYGDSTTATTTTIKAESGRLMVLRAEVPAGMIGTRGFIVNVRSPHLPKLPLNATGREEVSLDQFDSGNTRDWDGKLTIEIVSPHAALRSLRIDSKADVRTDFEADIPTIFLAGDSTVTDRDGGGDVSWGQILPVFFGPGVSVANHAQSGETLKSFANALRLDKILSQMKQGDYLFIQFTHNDSKASWPETYVDPETTYKDYLKVYIDEARLRGATPVLVTAMDRGARGTGSPTHGHGGYPQAMRELAATEHVALIDLYAMSDIFYSSAGTDAPAILADGTHSTAYGGYEFAKCIVTGIQQNKLPLASFIVPGFQPFDPAHPDTAASLNLAPLFSNGGGQRGMRPAASPTASPNANPRPTNPGPGPL